MKRNLFRKSIGAAALLLLSLATMASAKGPVYLQTDAQTGEKYLNLNNNDNVSDTLYIPSNVSTFKVYDDGGKDGIYSDNNRALYFLKAPDNAKIHVKGRYKLGSNDYIVIYDVYTSNYSEHKFLSKKNLAIDSMVYDTVSTSSEIAFSFKSDYSGDANSYNEMGLDFTVNVCSPRTITVHSTENGSVVSNKSTAFCVDTVTLNATPNKGYVLSGVVVKDDAGNVLDVDFDWSTAKFVMPNSNINIYPVFTSRITAEDGFYLDMPAFYYDETVSRSAALPKGTVSFNLYDEGGKDGDYHHPGKSYLQLTAPYSDNRFRITGSVQTNTAYAKLTVFDGDQNATKLVNGIYSPSPHAEKTDVGKPVSSGNVVTFYFVAYNFESAAGLDLKVELVSPITVAKVSHGSMTSDKKIAASGETVTLTMTFDEGYYPQVSVVDAEGNEVKTTEYSGYVYKFTMPNRGVTVTPVIARSPKVNIVQPSYGKIEVISAAPIIPEKTIELQVTPDDGYCFLNSSENMTITLDADGSEIATNSDYRSNVRYFTIPDGDVTVTMLDDAFYSAPHIYIENAANGSIMSNREYACKNIPFTLTATPDDGYAFRQAVLTDDDDNQISVIKPASWYSNVVSYYSMPMKNVHVTPVFSKVTADDKISLTVTTSGIKNFDIPYGLVALKVKGHSDKNTDGSLVLNAPDSYLLQIDIVMKAGEIPYGGYTDYLTIYDGDVTQYGDIGDAPQLWHATGKKQGSVQSNGNSITVNFKTGANKVTVSFTLNVKLIKPSFGAVAIAKADDNKLHATINGDYVENDTLSIPEAIEVEEVKFQREFTPLTPSTVMLPVALPSGATVNAEFYELTDVVEVDRSWKATMTNIKKIENNENALPQPNTPYAVILHEGESQLKFDLNGGTAVVQTGEIKNQWNANKTWFFTGTYAYKDWGKSENSGDLGLVYAFSGINDHGIAKGTFGRVSTKSTANPMRSYLSKVNESVKLQGVRGANGNTFASTYSINLMPETIDIEFIDSDANGKERTTAIGRMNPATGEIRLIRMDRTFDLKGRSVGNGKKARGAYYGKKVR